MCGRDAERKLALKVDILHVFTTDFSEIQFYRESPLAIGWTEQKCKEWDELAKRRSYISSHSRGKKRYQGQWYLTLNKEGNNGPTKLQSDFGAAVLMKIVHTTNQENKSKSVSIQINKDDGIRLQAHRGGTSVNGIGNELIRIFLN